jgi:hypothetical protein
VTTVMPKWEADCRDRIRSAIPGLAGKLDNFVASDANGTQTRVLVEAALEALGFNRFEDLAMEYRVK